MSLRHAVCLSLLISATLATTVRAATIGREQDIVDLKLGQRVMVDDGTCPAGQVKEVRGAKMTDKGHPWQENWISILGRRPWAIN